jgi:hypothetical protein
MMGERAATHGMKTNSRVGTGKDTDFLLEPPEDANPGDSLILAQGDTIWTSDLPELYGNKSMWF